MQPQDVLRQFLKRRPTSHKYDYGHVLVLGGSPGMVGAPILTGQAALRSGAGLVTIASTAPVTDKLEKRVAEIMTLTLPTEVEASLDSLRQFIRDRQVNVLAIGPGLKPSPKLIKKLLTSFDLPLIIDGGGLASLIGQLELLSKSKQSIILTPHAGEFKRLINQALPAQPSDLKALAQSFAEQHRVILVLKGQPTYVAQSDTQLYENPTGNAGLATAGTGDVLTGVIAGLMAQKVEPKRAVPAAVYLHGLAGDLAAQAKTQPGLIAADVIEMLPLAWQELAKPVV